LLAERRAELEALRDLLVERKAIDARTLAELPAPRNQNGKAATHRGTAAVKEK
jgi:hypothetical protein